MSVFSCGRSLYTDWRTVVVVGGGECHIPCKKGGGIVRVGEMSRGVSYTRDNMSCDHHAASVTSACVRASDNFKRKRCSACV